MAILAALSLLLWTTRNALHGTPVADDYDFLARLRLGPPIDPFDGGGFEYYWRPLTRQAYYGVLGGTLLAAPWVALVLHAAALLGLALLLWVIGRRTLPPIPALCFAVLPLVAESARLLLAWPTGAQPLFGALFAAAAVAAALAGRFVRAGLLLLSGLLSYEQSIAVAPILGAIAWRHSQVPRDRIRGVLPIGLALLAWVAGLATARSHGVRWPAEGTATALGDALAQAAAVLANADLVREPAGTILLVAQGVLIFAAVGFAWIRRGRRRGQRPAPGPPAGVLAGCAVIGLVGLVPAILAPTVWAPRHAFLPSLFLGYAIVGLLARAGAGFAPAWITLRATALLLAPAASAIVDRPWGDARTSFPELVRLQRIVTSTRLALEQAGAAQAGGATYWSMPPRAVVAFAGDKALKVWAGDSTFHWAMLARPVRSEAQRDYPALAFDVGFVDPAQIVDRSVLEDYFRVMDGSVAPDSPLADSILAAASLRNGPRPAAVLDELERFRAGLAAMRGDIVLADSLNLSSQRRTGTQAHHMAIAGWVALARGDERRAARLAALCLEANPTHATALALREALAQRAAGRSAPP